MRHVEHDLNEMEETLARTLYLANRDLGSIATKMSEGSGFLQKEIEEQLNQEVRDKIMKAKSLCTRFLRVTENAVNMAESLDPWERLKSLVFESDWYRKKFPTDYDRRKKLKELEREKKYIPEREDTAEREDQQLTTILEEIRKRREQRKRSMLSSRAAQSNDIEESINTSLQSLNGFITRYFLDESPIILAADKVQQRLHKSIKNLREYGLGAQVNLISEVFGDKEGPGRYIKSGNKAFLLPIRALLEQALETLRSLSSNPERVQEMLRKLPEEPVIPQQPTMPPKVQQVEELKKKIGAFYRQRQRDKMLQRLTN
jgi:hypothetical protein